jgi:hypothetical protein
MEAGAKERQEQKKKRLEELERKHAADERKIRQLRAELGLGT